MALLTSGHHISFLHPSPNPTRETLNITKPRSRFLRSLCGSNGRGHGGGGIVHAYHIIHERGLGFDRGDSFFRLESSVARDLGTLSASILRLQLQTDGCSDINQFRVLDAMCGCGVRALRYLAHAGAGFVWANDAFEGVRPLVLSNLTSAGAGSRHLPDGTRRWVVTHCDVNRLLAECYLSREFFDLIDVDSFGSNSTYLRSAIMALKFGGLLYVTSTDGKGSGGHRPSGSLASYGAYVRSMPYSNEVGLRMLIGGAVREASILGLHLSPVFSYYSYHGPVFRVMLKLDRGIKDHCSQYGFLMYCAKCGHSQAFSWNELGLLSCPCGDGQVSADVVVSGPIWIGPLHDAAFIAEMLNLATEWGWAYSTKYGMDLQKLLNLMIEESDPRLPPGYIKLDEISTRAKISSPPALQIINSLKTAGYAVSRSHVASNAIKTNCPIATCLQISRKISCQQ